MIYEWMQQHKQEVLDFLENHRDEGDDPWVEYQKMAYEDYLYGAMDEVYETRRRMEDE